MEFEIIQQFGTLANNTQGVCFDDNYIYISEASELMKYTKAGTFVARHDTTGDGINDHLGDCMIKDGIIYVTTSAYPSTPYNENVMLYNASDLSYTGTRYDTFTDHIAEGIDFRHGRFWTISDNFDEVYRWESGFTDPVTYSMEGPTITGSIHHFQTLVWLDGERIATQLHGGPSPALPSGVIIYRLRGQSFILEKIVPVPTPTYIFGQGMAWDADNNIMYFANRDDIGTPDMVTVAKLTNVPLFFSTQYPIDKIVGFHEGSFAIAAASTSGSFDVVASASTTINHGLDYRPFTDGLWSIDNENFRPTGVQLVTDLGNTSTASSFDDLVAVETATDTQLKIHAYSTDQSARTIYYKIWLLYPDD